jgi:hypothetical protein
MKTEWELIEDGYHREWRLISYPTGLVIGGVRGSIHQRNDGWCGWTDGANGRKNIGDYITEDLAKRAVESAQPSLDSKEWP